MKTLKLVGEGKLSEEGEGGGKGRDGEGRCGRVRIVEKLMDIAINSPRNPVSVNVSDLLRNVGGRR